MAERTLTELVSPPHKKIIDKLETSSRAIDLFKIQDYKPEFKVNNGNLMNSKVILRYFEYSRALLLKIK